MLGLATGSTPKEVYRHLVRIHREEGLSFQHVVTFNLDEYLGQVMCMCNLPGVLASLASTANAVVLCCAVPGRSAKLSALHAGMPWYTTAQCLDVEHCR